MPSSLNDAEPSELKQQAIEWLVRLRSDSIRDDEIHELATWLAQDYRHAEAFAFAEEIFDAMLLAAPIAQGSAPNQATKAPVAAPNAMQRKPVPSQRKQSNVCFKRWIFVALTLAAVWLFAAQYQFRSFS